MSYISLYELLRHAKNLPMQNGTAPVKAVLVSDIERIKESDVVDRTSYDVVLSQMNDALNEVHALRNMADMDFGELCYWVPPHNPLAQIKCVFIREIEGQKALVMFKDSDLPALVCKENLRKIFD